MADDPVNLRDEEIEALDRLARTRDGMLLHRYLRRILESCRMTDELGALQRHEGARIVARDLMGHMAQGIEGTSGRSDTSIVTPGGNTAGPRRASRSEQRRAAWAAQSAAEHPAEPSADEA